MIQNSKFGTYEKEVNILFGLRDLPQEGLRRVRGRPCAGRRRAPAQKGAGKKKKGSGAGVVLSVGGFCSLSCSSVYICVFVLCSCQTGASGACDTYVLVWARARFARRSRKRHLGCRHAPLVGSHERCFCIWGLNCWLISYHVGPGGRLLKWKK